MGACFEVSAKLCREAQFEILLRHHFGAPMSHLGIERYGKTGKSHSLLSVEVHDIPPFVQTPYVSFSTTSHPQNDPFLILVAKRGLKEDPHEVHGLEEWK